MAFTIKGLVVMAAAATAISMANTETDVTCALDLKQPVSEKMSRTLMHLHHQQTAGIEDPLSKENIKRIEVETEKINIIENAKCEIGKNEIFAGSSRPDIVVTTLRMRDNTLHGGLYNHLGLELAYINPEHRSDDKPEKIPNPFR